jgi:hypothetical protein
MSKGERFWAVRPELLTFLLRDGVCSMNRAIARGTLLLREDYSGKRDGHL